MNRHIQLACRAIMAILKHPIGFAKYAAGFEFFEKGRRFGASDHELERLPPTAIVENPLVSYYLNQPHAGMTKWIHYLDAFKPHFEELRDHREIIRILEIGVFAGGSLDMYQDFFSNQKLQIVGVDISEDCRKFAREGIEIEIGDQEDPEFWQRFLGRHAPFDIIIDDGGHSTEQQVVTIECLFRHLNPGGLYVVEDVAASNRFSDFMGGLIRALHARQPNSRGTVEPSPLQSGLLRIEVIPYAFLLRKRERDAIPRDFACPWVGTSWTAAAREVFRASNPDRDPPIWQAASRS